MQVANAGVARSPKTADRVLRMMRGRAAAPRRG